MPFHLASSLKGFAVVCALFALFLCGTAQAASEKVVLEVAADTPVVEIGGARKIIVRTLVRPETLPKKRVPLAVALVLDKSGSMASDRKMDNAKRGAIEALEYLGAQDVATVVVYDTGASTLLRPTNAGDKAPFSRAVSRVRAGGSTALYDGVELAARELQPFVKEGYVPRIVMLSDGMANVGPSSTHELAALGRKLAGREMTITTIGLGLDYNEDLMTALAAESGGNAYFAKAAESLPGIFARDMEDAVTLTARRVRITLTCHDGAQIVRALGREGAHSGNAIEVAVDNLYGGEKYALFEVELPQADTAAKPLRIASARLEYIDAETGRTMVQATPLDISFSADPAEVAGNRQADIAAQAEFARNAEVREQAVKLADEGRAQEASALLQERADSLQNAAPSAAPADGAAMQQEAEAFEALAGRLDSSGSMSVEERKENVNKAYRQKNQQAPAPEEDAVQ
jgi:Uncharacterized protein containing a von Willebrand factor type A (vWA) domain